MEILKTIDEIARAQFRLDTNCPKEIEDEYLRARADDVRDLCQFAGQQEALWHDKRFSSHNIQGRPLYDGRQEPL